MPDSAHPFSPTRRNWGSFAALVALQAQNAFNDNAVRFLLLPLGTALAAELGGFAKYYQHILAALLVLPFILVSPLAGWLADRFPKNRVILSTMMMQTGVFLAIMAAVHTHLLWLATLGFFLLALQATLLSPAKNGIIKELLGSARLNLGNGVVEMTLIVAILGGMFIGGWWFDLGYQGGPETSARAWAAAAAPLWWLTAATLISLTLTFGVQKSTARLPGARFHPRLLWGHFTELARLRESRSLRLSAAGVMFFWFFGAIAQLIIVQVAEEATGGQGGMGKATSGMIACASGGVALGAILAAFIGRKKIELGLIPVGGICMSLACAVTACLAPGSLAFHAGLLGIGMFSALFYIPLFAYLQELAPEAERGRLIASSNLLNNLGMILATLVQLAMMKMHVAIGWQFALLGISALAISFVVLRLLPDRFFRLLLRPLIRWFWRVRGSGMEHIPADGGTLMVCNHVSYVDAFLLSVACPRPIRFLMLDDYYRMWWARWFFDIFGAVPIAKNNPRAAIKAVANALRDGHLVCLFPEGKLTTTGEPNPFQAGMELMLKLSPAPVLPTSLHGIWGSFFSFAGGKPFSGVRLGRRHPVLVRFGLALPPTTTAAEAEAAVLRLLRESGK